GGRPVRHDLHAAGRQPAPQALRRQPAHLGHAGGGQTDPGDHGGLTMPDAPNFDKAALAWTLPWDADWVTAVAWLGPSRLGAAGTTRGDILLWQLPARPGAPVPAPVRRLDGHTNAVTRLLTTPDGKRLVSASYDHGVRVWDPHAPAAGADTVTLNATAREE